MHKYIYITIPLAIVILVTLVYGFSPGKKREFDSQNSSSLKASTITLAKLREHISFLSSDKLGGRVVGSPGFKAAADYAVRQFKEADLKPLIPSNGPGKTLSYLQEVPFIRKRFSVTKPMVTRTPEGEAEFTYEKSFKMLFYGGNNSPGKPLPVVFAGYGIDEEEHGWNDYKNLDLKGKVIVILPGAPVRDGKPVLPPEMHEKYIHKDKGFDKKFSALIKHRPAAILLVHSDRYSREWSKVRDLTRRTQLESATKENKKKSLFPDIFVVKRDVVESLFKNRDASPLNIENNGTGGYKTFEIKNAEIVLNYNVLEEEILSWNVAGMVKGSDPELAKEYIAVGAHLDHLPPRNGEICNGADDNASGSSGLLEIAEAVAMKPPRRPVIFILYTAEEWGLKGSSYFVKNCPVPTAKIRANINMDMIGRTNPKFMKNRAQYVVGYEKDWQDLKQVVNRVNRKTVQWPLMFVEQENIYGNSDHTSFHNAGIPAVNFWNGRHEDWHKPSDTVEKIDFEKAQKLSQLVYYITMELGTL